MLVAYLICINTVLINLSRVHDIEYITKMITQSCDFAIGLAQLELNSVVNHIPTYRHHSYSCHGHVSVFG